MKFSRPFSRSSATGFPVKGGDFCPPTPTQPYFQTAQKLIRLIKRPQNVADKSVQFGAESRRRGVSSLHPLLSLTLPGKFIRCHVRTFIRPSCALNALYIAPTLI